MEIFINLLGGAHKFFFKIRIAADHLQTFFFDAAVFVFKIILHPLLDYICCDLNMEL